MCRVETNVCNDTACFCVVILPPLRPARFKKANITTPIDREHVQELEKTMMKRKAQLYEIEQTLPQKNSLYLQIILGDVNVSILNRNDKVRYKDDYEKFKLILNGIALIMAIINLTFNSRLVWRDR